MAKKSKAELLATEVGGRTVSDWESDWETVEKGFDTLHPGLKKHVGLGRVILGMNTMYIFRATEYKRGGLAKGLRRISGPPQTGNAHYGAQMIRKHITELTLQILCMEGTKEAASYAAKLKNLFIKLEDPEWNRPHSKRMKQLQSARLAKPPKNRSSPKLK